MKPLFNVSVSSLKKIYDMPNTWSKEDYRKLLDQFEVEGVSDLSEDDLVDMMLMTLQDMEPGEAADAVLAYKLQNSVTVGARQNIVHDLFDDQRPWEETADIKLHSRIFAGVVLLHKAFPKIFTRPDMMQLVLHITVIELEARGMLSKTPEPAFVTRMLADGMSKSSILERLFEDQIFSHNFEESHGIIWLAEFSDLKSESPPSASLTIYSSVHWLKAMESVSNEYQSNAYNDIINKESKHE